MLINDIISDSLSLATIITVIFTYLKIEKEVLSSLESLKEKVDLLDYRVTQLEQEVRKK